MKHFLFILRCVSRETYLKCKQTYRKGTPARKGLDKEMGMSGTGTFVPMWKVKSNTQVEKFQRKGYVMGNLGFICTSKLLYLRVMKQFCRADRFSPSGSLLCIR